MENKYQEALDYLTGKTKGRFEICACSRNHKQVLVEKYEKLKNNEKTLQKLVDKETPMRVLVEVWELSSTDEKDILCPKCNALLGTTEERYESNYCYNCGQKLDWSDEDEK